MKPSDHVGHSIALADSVQNLLDGHLEPKTTHSPFTIAWPQVGHLGLDTLEDLYKSLISSQFHHHYSPGPAAWALGTDTKPVMCLRVGIAHSKASVL